MTRCPTWCVLASEQNRSGHHEHVGSTSVLIPRRSSGNAAMAAEVTVVAEQHDAAVCLHARGVELSALEARTLADRLLEAARLAENVIVSSAVPA